MLEMQTSNTARREMLGPHMIERARKNLSAGGPAVISENVSLSDAREFLEQNESRGFRCRFVPHDPSSTEYYDESYGQLIAWELPTHAHESVASCLMWQLIPGLRTLSGQKASVDLKPSPTIQVGNSLKEPDLTICPIAGGKQAQLLTVVFETGYQHETLEQLKGILGQWILIAQMAVGIKIFNETNGEVQMHILVYRKDSAQNPVKSIPFGTDVTVEGLVLDIPLSYIFFGSSNCQNEAIKNAIKGGECLVIDLSELQERILEVLLHR